MTSARQGSIAKRCPISAERIAGTPDYAIADGNSTFIVAVLSGWPDIPAETRR